MLISFSDISFLDVPRTFEKSTWAAIARNNYHPRDSISVSLPSFLLASLREGFRVGEARFTTDNDLPRSFKAQPLAENVRINPKSGAIQGVLQLKGQQKLSLRIVHI